MLAILLMRGEESWESITLLLLLEAVEAVEAEAMSSPTTIYMILC
jgi:hypothetical protein